MYLINLNEIKKNMESSIYDMSTFTQILQIWTSRHIVGICCVSSYILVYFDTINYRNE